MGSRGPRPLPDNVREFTGTGRRPLRAADLSDGVHPEVGLPPIPRWLGSIARQEWRRASKLLLELNLLTKIDLGAFSRYCGCWEEYALANIDMRLAEEALTAAGRHICEARTFVTPTGFHREHQRARRLRETAHDLEQSEACFGMNPSARARVVASRNDAQYRLPGMDGDEKPLDGFAAL